MENAKPFMRIEYDEAYKVIAFSPLAALSLPRCMRHSLFPVADPQRHYELDGGERKGLERKSQSS